MIKTYVIRRPSKVGHTVRRIGEPVPEAHLWRLTEGMVRSGRLLEQEMSETDFAAAVAKFCPAEADMIFSKVGVTPQRGQSGELPVLTVPATPIIAAPKQRQPRKTHPVPVVAATLIA